MALGGEIVNLIRLDFLKDLNETVGVRHVCVVEIEPLTGHLGIFDQVVHTVGIETGAAPLGPVHFVALVQQELGKVGTVLTSNTGDQSLLHIVRTGPGKVSPAGWKSPSSDTSAARAKPA